MIKEVFDIVKILGGAVTKGDPTEQRRFEQSTQILGHLTNKSNSIAKMASKRVYNYPVVITNAFGDDVETAFKIVKYAESVFAYFLLMSVGLEPVIQPGGKISMYLNQFSAEDMDRLAKEGIRLEIDLEKSGAYTTIPQSVEEGLYRESCAVYQRPSIKKWDRTIPSRDILTDSLVQSTEYVNKRNLDIEWNESGTFVVDSTTGKYYDRERLVETDKDGWWTDPDTGKRHRSFNYAQGRIDMSHVGVPSPVAEKGIGQFGKSVEGRMGKSLPTSITVNLYAGTHCVPITLGVKAIPHFIDSDEMQGIFKRIVDDGRLLSKIIKLRSGEISFFKDFLLGWDQIKSDQEFFQKVGRHSWYRKLLDRKINSKYKGLLGLKASIKQFLKEENILPTVTLVTTVNEISDAISYPYLEAVKKNKITKIVDSLMLLALIVYDPDRDLIHCHFNGITHPYIIPIKDLKGDKESDTVKLIESMSKLMMKSY